EKSAYHSIALLAKSTEKDISLLLPRACSTMDKIVDRYAITIYPYSLSFNPQSFPFFCLHDGKNKPIESNKSAFGFFFSLYGIATNQGQRPQHRPRH
ncbi:MAG: hypothetical protein KJ630_04105, partial [Proteobacteria bacterium]|nr:hypothetical protein [Pseudomonadota bacterium]